MVSNSENRLSLAGRLRSNVSGMVEPMAAASAGTITEDVWARAGMLAARTIRSTHQRAPGRRYPRVTCAGFYQPLPCALVRRQPCLSPEQPEPRDDRHPVNDDRRPDR